MDKNSILSKIASLFESVDAESQETIEVNLMEITTVDGKILNIDVLEVGAPIFVKEGEEFVPFVDGEAEVVYEDKTWVIKSDELGKIASIEEKATEEETPAEEIVEEVTEEMNTEFNAQAEIEKLKADFEALKEELKQIIGEKETALEAVTKENEELKEKFNKLPAAPSVKETIKKFEFKEEKIETTDLESWVKTLKK